MLRIICVLFVAVAATFSTFARADEPLQLANNAPERYIVVKGDTLWGIAGKFLQEPWRWPEIWRLNRSQIKNPHLIYPGDAVLLDYEDGRPRLRLGKNVIRVSPTVYNEPIERAIPSIPANLIEPFISRPLIVGAEELSSSPRVVGADESRVIVGNGDEIYAIGVDEPHKRWAIYRLGQPLREAGAGPKSEVLGYEAIYLGTAELKEKGEEVSVLNILTAKEEIFKGDRLIPEEEATLISYIPHKMEEEVSGKMLSVYGGVGTAGPLSVITLSLGEKDGLEPGHVLGLYGNRTTTYTDNDGRNRTLKLPEKRYGLVFVFRVFDRLSYGLVMEASHPLEIGDIVRNP
ncbi:MAG: LysM peptidoglycan-binding domain-containing protein [Zoogloeaceae bacterium]|nr:LysM peptidoglycan-binding domain-containing protein [Zoogloeaceae bacterium]